MPETATRSGAASPMPYQRWKFRIGFFSFFFLLLLGAPACLPAARVPEKTVVLTLDDAVKSQITFVAPLLEQLGFKATFFITHEWMDDKEHFLSWEDVADLHRRGFEIGNHTWTHATLDTPEKAAKLGQELDM